MWTLEPPVCVGLLLRFPPTGQNFNRRLQTLLWPDMIWSLCGSSQAFSIICHVLLLALNIPYVKIHPALTLRAAPQKSNKHQSHPAAHPPTWKPVDGSGERLQ